MSGLNHLGPECASRTPGFATCSRRLEMSHPRAHRQPPPSDARQRIGRRPTLDAGEKENALMRNERKERIGDRLDRHTRAQIAMEVALGERDLAFAGFEKPVNGAGIIAVAINGERVLMHLGTDEADAMFRLAHLASLRS